VESTGAALATPADSSVGFTLGLTVQDDIAIHAAKAMVAAIDSDAQR
jgi:hypothetical protein